ncbi:hypothetical protein M231_02821 [Tremella mesenterica]|uniref:Uncharacterized protein n=1 Tax=Tremella mesenterica TaxID=5217 RepID=A0A4V1M4C5_TREME|nr:hypothetical protein M231_02821 [Tremella mesenterica]
MSYLLRDSTATIVHIDDEVIRASVGVGELFSPPTVTLRACYGVPISIPSAIESAGSTAEEGKQNWLVGNTLENVTSVTGWEEKVELRWPFVSEQGKKDDWEGREVLL